MKRNIIVTLVAILALITIASLAIPSVTASIASAATQQSGGAAMAPASSSLPKLSALSDLEAAYQDIYTRVSPSVVLIEVASGGTQASGSPNSPFGPGQGLPQQGLGTGFIWDTQGNIVTNNHVVDGADQITVTFSDGTVVDGKVVATDPYSDLAVVNVKAPANLLKVIQMGDSSQLKVGQLTIAIGNPYGEENTMTTGIISAIGRSLPVDLQGGAASASGPTYSIADVIQTDAAINPGNSGGVLLNSQGQVIGVTNSIESASGSSAGIGFAIPASIVQKVVPALIKTGRYDHPYLGISGGTLTPTIAKAMGLSTDQRGALVGTVTPGGPAEKAGLKGSTQKTTVNGVSTTVGGDVITAIEGKQVKAFDDLIAYLASSTQVNQPIKLTILRDGKEQTVTVTLAARPAS